MASIFEQEPPTWGDQARPDNQRDFAVQSIISLAFGLSALLAFCVLRPRWTSLYAARKRQKNAAAILPELPDTFFGWIPALYRITEEQVLASAGLDAYVFLSFFRLAIKFIALTFFLQLVIMFPVHYTHTGGVGLPAPGTVRNPPNNDTNSTNAYSSYRFAPLYHIASKNGSKEEDLEIPPSETMLWLYLMFVYLFSGIALYLIVTETKKIIRVRQAYLGSQSTVTDRTIRLSGIPEELRSEELIKETIENLQIGKVDSVLLCKDWSELDELLARRQRVLRKLEEAWTVYLGPPKTSRSRRVIVSTSESGENGNGTGHEESSHLLGGNANAQNRTGAETNERPKTRIWYGFLGLQSRLIDAIDYYEEKLRKLDEEIKSARKKVFKPTPLAFVTMDSTAAAQMSVQATMDPEPMKLLAKLAPAPPDVIWRNTYLSRPNRMARAWTITVIIAVLTVFWSLILVPVAGLLTLTAIGRLSPQLESALRAHQTSRALFQSTLPTLVFSLLSVAVPYLYYWLSTLQGMTSQGEIEMSVISKNFFFTFFNLFVIFTVFGTVSNFSGYLGYLERLNETLKDTSKIADILARSLKNLVSFYMNLIILQGIGLFPFRLLEFGSVFLYPLYLMGSKTPRDYAELVEPPVFSYGFYLPQTLLIFIICIVYSTLPASWFILFFGLVYFILGGFIYKYQLLYAMDHRQHSTGKAWPIICNRIVLGLVVFQITMAGILGLSQAWKRAILTIPLLIFTIWFIVFYQRTYEPLMKFIAIRSLNHDPPFGALSEEGQSRPNMDTSRGRNADENEETGLRYINPSLTIPLEGVWLAKRRPGNSDTGNEDGETNV